jgi:hypothetical protein
MKLNFFKWVFQPTEKEIYQDINLYSIILDMQERIEKLESENIELTNSLYEFENRLQAQIDNIHPVVYNLQDFTLDK